MILSYSLHGRNDLYSLAFPLILVSWRLRFPSARFMIHIHKSARQSPAAILARRVDLPIEILDYDEPLPQAHGPTYLTLWRLRPLWSENQIVAPRDIDSIPCHSEVSALLDFERSTAPFSTIRRHKSDSRIEGSLSAFRPEACIPPLPHSHKEFTQMPPCLDPWGSCLDDERALIFYLRPMIKDSIHYSARDLAHRPDRRPRHKSIFKELDEVLHQPPSPPALDRLLRKIARFPGRTAHGTPSENAQVLTHDFPACRAVSKVLEIPELRDFYLRDFPGRRSMEKLRGA